MELSNKLVIITGASRGIGRALTMELAKCGCNLLLTALESDELNKLQNELQSIPVKVGVMASDLTDQENRTKFLNWIKENEQPPDILVNNVGMGGKFARFENIDLSNIERTVALNVSSFIQLTHELIPILHKRPQAKIVNISSGIARLPYPGLAVYGATKGFVSSFSESLACELADSNIDVHCFYPGFTSTHFMASSEMDMGKIPGWMIHTPESVARRIVRALRKDYRWYYSDFGTKLLPVIGSLIPHRLKIYIFKNLFWELPNGTK
jgi:short-subunit dehydrogenase